MSDDTYRITEDHLTGIFHSRDFLDRLNVLGASDNGSREKSFKVYQSVNSPDYFFSDVVTGQPNNAMPDDDDNTYTTDYRGLHTLYPLLSFHSHPNNSPPSTSGGGGDLTALAYRRKDLLLDKGLNVRPVEGVVTNYHGSGIDVVLFQENISMPLNEWDLESFEDVFDRRGGSFASPEDAASVLSETGQYNASYLKVNGKGLDFRGPDALKKFAFTPKHQQLDFDLVEGDFDDFDGHDDFDYL